MTTVSLVIDDAAHATRALYRWTIGDLATATAFSSTRPETEVPRSCCGSTIYDDCVAMVCTVGNHGTREEAPSQLLGWSRADSLQAAIFLVMSLNRLDEWEWDDAGALPQSLQHGGACRPDWLRLPHEAPWAQHLHPPLCRANTTARQAGGALGGAVDRDRSSSPVPPIASRPIVISPRLLAPISSTRSTTEPPVSPSAPIFRRPTTTSSRPSPALDVP